MATKDYPNRDYSSVVGQGLRSLLAADERVLAASPLVKDPGSTDDVSVTDELKNLLDPTILLGLGTHPGGALQRAVFGRAVTGAPGSIARRLFEEVERTFKPAVAVTNTRLLIVEIDFVPRGKGFLQRWFGEQEAAGRLIHQVPRTAILGAVAAPAGVLRRGRLLVGFADGSGCVLVCTPVLAAAVISGIGAPRPAGGPSRPDDSSPGEGRA